MFDTSKYHVDFLIILWSGLYMIYVLYHQHNMILLLLAGRFRCTDGGGEAAGPRERAGEEGVPGGGADTGGAQPP